MLRRPLTRPLRLPPRKASPPSPQRPRLHDPDPLAPRLRSAGASPERQALERELKKARVRLVELERRITESEQAVKSLEAKMAEPGFYDDREHAARAAEEHQNLMWETGALISQW